jgi:predicted lipid-binding transport protein (Tim44 family)
MGEGFQFIDIIFFAMIAAFLALRLRSVLGRRDGHEGGYRDPFKRVPEPHKAPEERPEDNVVLLPERKVDEEKLKEAAHGDDTLASGLIQIKLADPSFEPEAFLAGARQAFEMVLDAFANGDTATLKSMLNAEVFANFAQAIKGRAEAGETLKYTLVGIRSAEIVEAYMEGRNASVTVKFVSEQINATVNAKDAVIGGDLNKVVDVTDFWTFQRDTRARDPNWTLVATRSLD